MDVDARTFLVLGFRMVGKGLMTLPTCLSVIGCFWIQLSVNLVIKTVNRPLSRLFIYAWWKRVNCGYVRVWPKLHVTSSRFPCNFKIAHDVTRKTTTSTEAIRLRSRWATSRCPCVLLLNIALELYMYDVLISELEYIRAASQDIQMRISRTEVAWIVLLAEVSFGAGIGLAEIYPVTRFCVLVVDLTSLCVRSDMATVIAAKGRAPVTVMDWFGCKIDINPIKI